jgi:serine/threonine protein kinase
LQRFGEDLLEVLKFLEEEAGVPHRDIKPDNIAIGQIILDRTLNPALDEFGLTPGGEPNRLSGE